MHERALSDSSATGMGTTMTVALFQAAGEVVIGHVGDSRAYLLRDRELVQLTDDHSLVAELVRRGELSPEQAEVHPQRSVITRALGTEPLVDIDAFTVSARDGDVFLLCSDGLTTMVDAATVSQLVQRYRSDLTAACRALIAAANDRGGEDNITAVLFAVAADDGSPAAGPPHLAEEDTLHPEDGVPAAAVVRAASAPMPAAHLDAAPAETRVVEAPPDPLQRRRRPWSHWAPLTSAPDAVEASRPSDDTMIVAAPESAAATRRRSAPARAGAANRGEPRRLRRSRCS